MTSFRLICCKTRVHVSRALRGHYSGRQCHRNATGAQHSLQYLSRSLFPKRIMSIIYRPASDADTSAPKTYQFAESANSYLLESDLSVSALRDSLHRVFYLNPLLDFHETSPRHYVQMDQGQAKVTRTLYGENVPITLQSIGSMRDFYKCQIDWLGGEPRIAKLHHG